MHQDERWQVYNENGSLRSQPILASQAHQPGTQPVLLGIVCVWLYRRTPGGIEVLFQKRSPYVSRNQNKWDTSGGGHIDFGEDLLDAAARELHEEVGATADKSKLQFLFTRNDGHRVASVFLYDYTDQPNSEADFHFDDQEVSEVRWVPLSDLPEFWCENAKRSLATDFVHRYCLMEKLNSLQ